MGPIMIMAGGTGGHVFPALAVAARLRELGAEVFWVGTQAGIEARLVPAAGIPIEWLPVEGLRGGGIARWLRAPWLLARALGRVRAVIRQRRPAAALGMGGFAAGPGGLAARWARVPLVIHEQNRVPGLTNRWLARWAARVYEAFPASFPGARGARVAGNPVRAEIAALPPPEARGLGQRGPLRLLVLGGSRGALALNELVPQALARLASGERPQVRHQTGEATLAAAQAAYGAAGVTAEITPFIADMAAVYGWADLVLARAGALTLSELAAAGVGALLVPYPHAVDDHQTRNAEWLVAAGAARLLPQADLTPERLAAALTELDRDRAALLRWAQAARAQARVTAADLLARACLEVAR